LSKTEKVSRQKNDSPESVQRLPYKYLVETALEGIWAIDEHANTIYVNESICGLLGYSYEEMIHQPFSSFIHHDEIIDHNQKMAQRSKGVQEVYERKFIKKDGSEILMTVSARPIFDDDGQFVGSFGHFTDITESKRRDRAIQLVMKTQSELSLITDVDHVYQLIGSRIEELLPEGIIGLISVDDRQHAFVITHLFGIDKEFDDLVERLNVDPKKILYPIKNAPLYELEIFRSGKFQEYKGDLYQLLMKKIPKSVTKAVEKQLQINFIRMMGFVSEGNFFGGLIVVSKTDLAAYSDAIETIIQQATQVIKRLRSEEYKILSEDRLKKTFEAIDDGYWDWNVKTGHILVNDKWYTMLGYTPGEFDSTYENFCKLVHPNDWEKTKGQIEQALKSSDSFYSVEFRLRTKSNEYKHILSRGKIILPTNNNEAVRMVGTHVDITDRKRLEQMQELFYDTQRKLVQVDNFNELYELVGNSIVNLLPEGYAVITRSDILSKTVKVAGFYGFGKKLPLLMKKFNLSFSNFDIKVEDIEKDALAIWQKNSLVKYDYGIYGIVTKKIPKSICQSIEKLLEINEIYVMGCSWNHQDFGGFVILLKNGLGEYRQYIETLINDTAIAIKRILTEEVSRTNQARYRNIFEKSPVGIVTIGTDLKFISANHEFCKFIGYTAAEIEALGLKDVTHPDHIKNDLEQVNALLAGKISGFSSVTPYIRKNGEVRWGRILVNMVNEKQGEKPYLLAMITDISREKIAEEAIKENQRFLEMVLDTIPNYVFVRDIDGKYRLTNKSFAEAMGSTTADIFGKTDKELGSRTKLADYVSKQDREIIKTGKDWINPDLEILFPRIGMKSVQLVKRALPDTKNKKPAVLGIITDLSEQKKMKQALEESEERYRTLVESSPAGVMLSQNNKIIYANRSALRLFGCKKTNELVGKNVLSFVHSDSLELVTKKILDPEWAVTNLPMEIKIKRKDGKICEVESISTQVTINSESAILVFAQDITDRKLVEVEIQKHSEDLSLLKRLNDSVNRGDPLQQSLASLVEDAKRIFSSLGAAVYLLSADKKHLELQSYQIKAEVLIWLEQKMKIKIPSAKIDLDKSVLYKEILKEKKFRLIDDRAMIIQLMAEFANSSLVRRLLPSILNKLAIHSVIAIPIISNDESVGLLELSSLSPFTRDDLNRLELISSELGSILRRRQAESALKESEANFRQIVERSNDIFFRQDFDTLRMDYISPIVSSVLGFEVNEIKGINVEAIVKYIHPEDLEKFADFKKNLLRNWRKGESYYTVEFRLRTKQGDYKWFIGNYSLLLDEDDKPKTIMCTLADTTERKHYEQSLRFRVKLMQLASGLSTDELLQVILEEIEEITDSKIGFYFILEDDELSIEHHICSIGDYGQLVKGDHAEDNCFDSCGSVWQDCLKSRRPLIVNDSEIFKEVNEANDKLFEINRELVVPVMRENRIVSVLGVGNKMSDYTINDLTTVSKLADLAWDIVENKKIEAELQESEAIFSAFMENSPVYVFFKDKQIRAKQLSRNYEQLLKKPLDQLINKTMDEIFPTSMAKDMIEQDKKVLSGQNTEIVEEEHNGRFFTTIRFPIFIDGSIQYVAGFTIDNTKRVLSEKKLAESEEMYRLISSVVSDYLFSSIVTEDGDLDLQWVAGAFETMTGYALPEYKEKGGWRKMLYPGDKAVDDRDMQNLMQNKKVITEVRTIKRDGSIVWVRVYSQPIWDEEKNKLVGINGAVQDITERKKAEEEIQKSAREFEALYESARDFSLHRDPYVILSTITDRACTLFNTLNAFVYIYDPDTDELVLRFNKEYPSSLGLRLKMGEGLSGIVGQKKVPMFINDYQSWPGHLPEYADSQIAAIMCVPMLYAGQLIGVLGIHENHPSEITFSEEDAHFLSLFASQAAAAIYSADLFEQLRQNAAELEGRVDERTKELRTKNKELETFTYTVSHDLKAPLRGISGYSSLLMEDYADQLDDEGKRYLSNLVNSTERMNLLIEDLLSYSRVERREIKKSSINLNELVEKTINEYQQDIKSENIQFKLQIEYGTLITDREALSQALRNLIDNAVKFTKGCKNPEIVIRSEKVENTCLISIQDNGIGFEMKYYDKIFEIFQRLHLTEEYPGTGVGLAVVRKAIERLGGKIWAVSEPGSGSTFYLELPL